MRRPTTEELIGLRQLLDRAHFRLDDRPTAAERAAEAWIDDVLQTAGEDGLVEVLIDLDAKDREQRWCTHCPGNSGYGYCVWYDLFDVPDDGSPDDAPDVLHTENPAAPELCPFRQPGRAVLVRALP